jgi:predicted nucleotide-binding protein
VKRGIAILDSALLELGMRETDGQSVAPENAVESLSGVVFIVHGHDTNSLVDVAHTISRLTGEDPVILHEQPNRGQTIIEKFERHATDAGFVVVLATADDLGRAKDATDLNPRARQNVVFELGYFIGALGRPKVAVLYDEGVELPSDMAGVVYIPNDSAGGWRLTLAREMRAAGLHADSNRI